MDVLLDLHSGAYENEHSPVFHAWLKLESPQRLDSLRDRYVFFSITASVGAHIQDLMRLDYRSADAFVQEVLQYVDALSHSIASFTEEWFKGVDRLCLTLSGLNFIPEARVLVHVGQRTGVGKYPRIATSLLTQQSYLDALTGHRESASEVALRCIRRPHLLPGSKELPSVFHRLMHSLAGGNFLREYRIVLWMGASHVSTSASLRDSFIDQIAKTYRGTFRALIHPSVPLKYRIPFLLGRLASVIGKLPFAWLLRYDRPFRWLHLAVLYVFGRLFFLKSELFVLAASPSQKAVSRLTPNRASHVRESGKRKILVTRAMGGIGDILMMTPGLRALAQRYPSAQIDFAVPKSFAPVLEGIPGVNILKIDEDEIQLPSYRRWINLTDCPAGRVESRQYPNVRSNRIEIFAKAMGISRRRLRVWNGYRPFYEVQEAELNWSREYLDSINPKCLPVVGIQPVSADSYKNWTKMQELAETLSASHLVLIFHHEKLPGFDGPNIVKVLQSFRKSAALLSHCKSLVAVDSAFVHLAAALQIPTVAIFGPTSGKVFCRHYPTVRYISPSKVEFPCSPCWRNEHKPCHLTAGRESICLRSISVSKILEALHRRGSPSPEAMTNWTNFKSWIFYGRE